MENFWRISALVLLSAAIPQSFSASSTVTIIQTQNFIWIIQGGALDVSLLLPGLTENPSQINVMVNLVDDVFGNPDPTFDPYGIVIPFLHSKPNVPDTTTRSPRTTSTVRPVKIVTSPDAVDNGDVKSNTHILNNCIFYTNMSYTCRFQCDDDNFEPTTIPFPDNANIYYYIYNCSADSKVPEGQKWSKDDGILSRDFDEFGPSKVLATCTFYQTNWYECFDVADCTRGNTQCRGGTPWRGFYNGDLSTGYRGNLTAKAVSNGGSSASTLLGSAYTKDSDDHSGPAHSIKNYCDIEAYANSSTQIRCYRVSKACSSQDEPEQCRSSFIPITENTLSDPATDAIFNNMGKVEQSIKAYPNLDMNAKCYFYVDNSGDTLTGTSKFYCNFPSHSRDSDISELRAKYAET